MKPTVIIYTILIALGISSCKNKPQHHNDELSTTPVSQYPNTAFVPTLESKIDKPNTNILYTTTLLYAWDELRNVLGGNINVSPGDTELTYINNSISYKNTLSPNEYNNTVEKVEDLIKIKSSFKIKLPFADELQETELEFDGKTVKAFGMEDYDYKIADEVGILYYKNDDCFVITLHPSTSGHTIYLAKGFNNHTTLSDILADVKEHIKIGKEESTNEKAAWKYRLVDADKLRIPELFLDVSNSYDNIIKNTVVGDEGQYKLNSVTQRIALEINKSGAKVESEADIALAAAVDEEMGKPKYLILNKPYVIYLQKDKSDYPYFMMKVQNTTFMKNM